MQRIITLTTDFGLDDGYVGTIKGVILSIYPEASIVDISHGITAQDIPQAAFIIGTAYRFFPPHTIHVVVVDPGVGSQRRALALATAEGFFVAPDNGVLSQVLKDQYTRALAALQIDARSRWPSTEMPLPLKGLGVKAVALTNPTYWLATVSKTFHARDLFAPVAAHLANGVPLEHLGTPIQDAFVIHLPQPQKQADGTIMGHVTYVDHFGNLITDLTPSAVAALPGEPVFEIAGHRITGLSHYYGEHGGLLALVGSAGYIEIAASNASAAQQTMARRGTPIRVRPAS